jgi:hypothetical protein
MKHTVGLLFEVGHNKLDNIPFKVSISNLATTLTSWAKDLNLNVPRGTNWDRVNHLATYQGLGIGSVENDVNFVGLDKQCKFCNIPDHTADNCQLFNNLLMASRCIKQLLNYSHSLNPNYVCTHTHRHIRIPREPHSSEGC